MNFKELGENLGLEEDEYLELIKLLIETSRADMARIESAAKDENSDEVANRLHSIKGAAGNLGLIEIYNLAKQGEQIARNNALDQLPDIVQGLKTRLNSLAEIVAA